MIHDTAPVVPPLVAATNSVTPSPEPPPSPEATLPSPTAEQTQAVDGVFTTPPQRDAAATLFGVWTSAMLLRDVAVDTFTSAEKDPSEYDEGEEEEPTD
jgi:hypothetical protein